MRNEARFRVVERTDPERFKEFLRSAESGAERYACTSNWPASMCRGSRHDRRRAGRQRPKGGVAMDFSTTILGSSSRIRYRRAPRRLPTSSTPSGVSKTPAPRRSSCGRYSKSRSREQMAEHSSISTRTANRSPRRPAISPGPTRSPGPGPVPRHLRRVKETVHMPVIASLNGTTPGGWLEYARLMEQAGADAIELNVYRVAPDPRDRRRDRAPDDRYRPGGEAGRQDSGRGEAVAVLHRVRAHGARDRPGGRRRPGAVQPLLPAGHRHRGAGVRHLHLSSSSECCRGLHWMAILSGRSRLARGHRRRAHRARRRQGDDGRRARHPVVSALLMNGRVSAGARDLTAWMEEHEWESLSEMRGNLSFLKVPTPRLTNARTTCSCCRVGRPDASRQPIPSRGRLYEIPCPCTEAACRRTSPSRTDGPWRKLSAALWRPRPNRACASTAIFQWSSPKGTTPHVPVGQKANLETPTTPSSRRRRSTSPFSTRVGANRQRVRLIELEEMGTTGSSVAIAMMADELRITRPPGRSREGRPLLCESGGADQVLSRHFRPIFALQKGQEIRPGGLGG